MQILVSLSIAILLPLTASAVVFNKTQVFFRASGFAQTLDELHGNAMSGSIGVVKESFAQTQQDVLHPVSSYMTVWTTEPSQKGHVFLSPMIRKLPAGMVELGASELFGTDQRSSQGHVVGFSTSGSRFMGTAQFQLRQVHRTGVQWTDSLIFAANYTETRHYATYDDNGNVSGWIFANTSIASSVALIPEYNVAEFARTDRFFHVLAGIASSGKWLTYDAQTGRLLQRVQVFPPGSFMYPGQIAALSKGTEDHVFFTADKAKDELAGIARENKLKYTPSTAVTAQGNVVLLAYNQIGTPLLAEVLSQPARCKWLSSSLTPVLAAFTDSSSSTIRIAVVGSCLVLNSDQELGLLYVTTLRLSSPAMPATALLPAAGMYRIYDEDYVRHRSTFVRSAVFINQARAVLVGGETGLWQVSTGSVVEYGDAFLAVWSVFSGHECVYTRWGTPRRDGAKNIARAWAGKPSSPTDDGAFYIGVQWNAPITHDAPENAYSQWKLELLSVDLQSCNCSNEVCAVGPLPKPDDKPADDKLKTILAAVGGSLAAALLVGVLCYYVRTKQRALANDQQEPLVKRSVQTTGVLDP